MMNEESEEPKSFTDTQVGVLIEEMDKRYVLLAEGQSGLRKETYQNRKTIGKTLERMTQLELTVTGLKGDVSELKGDVSGLKEAFSGMKTTTDRILSDTTEIKKKVAGHENRLITLETA